MNKTQEMIMTYLVNAVKGGKKVESIRDLAQELDLNYFTLSDNLIKLNKLGKIVYSHGKIRRVYTENYKGNVVLQNVEQHKNKYSVKEFEEKYDKCVKEIVCDYIKTIDASAFTNENINKALTNITNITNNLKDKLFK